MSTFSENKSENQQKRSDITKNSKVDVTKQNLSQFVQNAQNNWGIITTLRALINSQNQNLSQKDALLKYWQKQINEHILPRSKFLSIPSYVRKQVHIQKFLKTTIVLLRKHYGICHVYRSKVWPFIFQDKLGISNSLYIELLDRRSRGWVSEITKKQIQKDITRSFNGHGTKQKLHTVHRLSLQRIKSSTQKQLIKQPEFLNEFQTQKSLQTSKKHQRLSIDQLDLSNKQEQELDDNAIQSSQNFRIAQDVTQVLELFYIYRPDIGFVQGMTYPTIVLTLVAGKISSFRILCNLLLCNEFFRKMITFEPNFINYFCRIFDQLLLSYNLNLYNLIFKQFQIKSQIFLVDWFFTFFSRGISPSTILRIWDLLLYKTKICPDHPEIILYRISLIIFQLLEPILIHTTYEQCISSIRQYSKKIDQQKLILNLYDSFKDSGSIKTFEQKYIKIRMKVEKKYFVGYEE